MLTKNYPFANRQDIVNHGVARETSIDIPAGATAPPFKAVPDAANQVYYYEDPKLVTGRAQHFNLVVQREMTPRVTVEMGYVGSTGRQMPYTVGNLNRGGRLSPDLGRVESLLSLGESDYHSLQVKTTRRFSAGLRLLAGYTFANSTDNGPAPFNLDRGKQEPQDAFNLAAERAASGNDIRHNLVVSGIYELPFRPGPGPLRAALSDWQVNAIFNLRLARHSAWSGTAATRRRQECDRTSSGILRSSPAHAR